MGLISKPVMTDDALDAKIRISEFHFLAYILYSVCMMYVGYCTLYIQLAIDLSRTFG